MAKVRTKATTNGAAHAGEEKPTACYALSLSLENVRCFGPKVTLDLSDGQGRPAQWTIILGENGTGKTTLLQAMVCVEMIGPPTVENQRAQNLDNPRLVDLAERYRNSSFPDSLGLIRRAGESELATCELRWVLREDLRSLPLREPTHLASWTLHPWTIKLDEGPSTLIFYAYGAGRRLRSSSLTADQRDDHAGTLFDEHATLRNAEEWLLRLDYSSSKPSDIRAEQKARLEQVKELLVSILPDVEDIRFTTPTGPNPTPRVEFQTFSGWVPLRRLGYGYQTLVAWVTDFASRMVERYPDSPDPLKEPAIVVVDEIDLHLHPTWQRKLIGFLSERFPNTQFIATAHSPLVVQAAGNANIAVLKKVDDHVEIDNDVDRIRGWRIEQILTSDLFGLTSADPPEVEKLLNRKRELLAKTKLMAAEKAELTRIQAEIDALPVGDSAQHAKEMDAIRKALDLLQKKSPG